MKGPRAIVAVICTRLWPLPRAITLAVTLYALNLCIVQYKISLMKNFYKKVIFISGCTGINTELASTMETTAKFPVHSGTVVEVTCSDPKAILKGSNRVTCVSGTGFSYMEEPMCSLPGNHCDVIVISN